ncbi:MAG: hypothetical protein AAB215_07520 [Planctomycetota bacterium]
MTDFVRPGGRWLLGAAVLLALAGCPANQADKRGTPEDYPIEERYDRVFQHYLTPAEKAQFGVTDRQGQWHCRLEGETRTRFIERIYRTYLLGPKYELAILERKLLPGMTEKMAQLSWGAPLVRRRSLDGREWLWIYVEQMDRWGSSRPLIYIVFNWHKEPGLRFVQTWFVDAEAAARSANK